MLKRAFIFSFFGLIVFIFLFFINLFIVGPKDLEEFEKIEQKSSDFKSQTAHQIRKNVKKDLWIMDKDSFKHYVILSDLSELFLNRKNQKYELIENLDKITFLCLENVIENPIFQHVKYITAKSGIYFFPEHKLELNDINLSFINTLKTTKYLDMDFQNAYFKGKAKNLNFSITKKQPIIEASSFEGSFNPKKGLKWGK